MLLTFEQARRVVEEHARSVTKPASERVELLQTGGRVLAESVVADRDLPPFSRAARDGFAVRAQDVAAVPCSLKVVAEVRAGMDVSGIRVGPGECAEIMTGAATPEGADAVVMVEYTSRSSSEVQVQRSVAAGENVVPRGSEAQAGAELVRPGMRLTPAAIAAAASVGMAQVEVYRKPRVAILSTGDEIVGVSEKPLGHQIRNSNTYSLVAQVVKAGGAPWALPVAPDEQERLRELIERGLEADLLLMTGGVSMGKYDLVEVVLKDLGAEFFFTGAQIQPGKPIVFGRIGKKYFFGLPGNPVSTMVTFELFARAMVEALSGAELQPLRFLHAKLKREIKTKTGLTRFLPAILSGEFGHTEVELVSWQGSGDIAATSRANCFAVIPADREMIPAGEWVAVLPV